MKTTLKSIEWKVVDLGYQLPSGFFNKLKRGMVHFTEKNVKEGNYRGGGCCSDPDLGKK